MDDTYLTIVSSSQGIYKDKGSKFLSFAFPVSSVEEAMQLIDGKRKEYHDARHVCYAYMLGKDRVNFRTNDDGEPSGTAGKPILGQINSKQLTDILIVVAIGLILSELLRKWRINIFVILVSILIFWNSFVLYLEYILNKG